MTKMTKGWFVRAERNGVARYINRHYDYLFSGETVHVAFSFDSKEEAERMAEKWNNFEQHLVDDLGYSEKDKTTFSVVQLDCVDWE